MESAAGLAGGASREETFPAEIQRSRGGTHRCRLLGGYRRRRFGLAAAFVRIVASGCAVRERWK